MSDSATCLGCGKPLPSDARCDRRYCDRACNNRHYKRIRRGKASRPVEPDPAHLLAAMTPQQLGWVAGIIEGEGAVGVSRHKHPSVNHTYEHPLIQVSMTDEDVIRRLGEWTGLGRVTGPHLPPSRASKGYQPQWHWAVRRHRDVEALAEVLWPLLGERRREQVTAMRERMASRVVLRTPKKGTD